MHTLPPEYEWAVKTIKRFMLESGRKMEDVLQQAVVARQVSSDPPLSESAVLSNVEVAQRSFFENLSTSAFYLVSSGFLYGSSGRLCDAANAVVGVLYILQDPSLQVAWGNLVREVLGMTSVSRVVPKLWAASEYDSFHLSGKWKIYRLPCFSSALNPGQRNKLAPRTRDRRGKPAGRGFCVVRTLTTAC